MILTYTKLGKTYTEKIETSMSRAKFYTLIKYCGCLFVSIKEI
jgi:hypothetical protein